MTDDNDHDSTKLTEDDGSTWKLVSDNLKYNGTNVPYELQRALGRDFDSSSETLSGTITIERLSLEPTVLDEQTEKVDGSETKTIDGDETTSDSGNAVYCHDPFTENYLKKKEVIHTQNYLVEWDDVHTWSQSATYGIDTALGSGSNSDTLTDVVESYSETVHNAQNGVKVNPFVKTNFLNF